VVGLSDNGNELLYLMAASLFNLPKHESKLSRRRVVALRVVTDEQIRLLCFILVI
jgi:hypothetical protein